MTTEPFDVLRIHQDQLLEGVFEDVLYRTPILAGRFHGDLGNVAVLQPGPALFQVSREGAEGPLADFHFRLASRRQNADRHVLLRYVDAATAAIPLGFPCAPSIAERRTPGELIQDIPTRVHPRERRQQLLVPVSAS